MYTGGPGSFCVPAQPKRDTRPVSRGHTGGPGSFGVPVQPQSDTSSGAVASSANTGRNAGLVQDIVIEIMDRLSHHDKLYHDYPPLQHHTNTQLANR